MTDPQGSALDGSVALATGGSRGIGLDVARGLTFVPGMVERRSGRVVDLSACLGRMSGPGTAGGLAPYRVSKAAVNALTKDLSAELGDGRRGVLVDAVCPGSPGEVSRPRTRPPRRAARLRRSRRR